MFLLDSFLLQVISFFRAEILPQVALIPPDDLKFVIMVFNKGSLHGAVMDSDHSMLQMLKSVYFPGSLSCKIWFTLRYLILP